MPIAITGMVVLAPPSSALVDSFPNAVQHQAQPVHPVRGELQLVLVVGEQLHHARIAVRHTSAQLLVQGRQGRGGGPDVTLERHARVRQLEEGRQAAGAGVAWKRVGVIERQRERREQGVGGVVEEVFVVVRLIQPMEAAGR